MLWDMPRPMHSSRTLAYFNGWLNRQRPSDLHHQHRWYAPGALRFRGQWWPSMVLLASLMKQKPLSLAAVAHIHISFFLQLLFSCSWRVNQIYGMSFLVHILYACPSVETLQAYLEGFYVFQLPLLISKMLHAATL